MSTADETSPLTLDPEALRCPHRYFDRLREQSPVAWLEELESFAVTRHADVVDILRRPAEFSSRRVGGSKASNRFNALAVELLGESRELHMLLDSSVMVGSKPALLNADPPRHAQQRTLVNRAFTPRKVQGLETDIRAIADRLIDGFSDRGCCEFLADFAVGFPLLVISRTLGLPEEDLPLLKRWSDDSLLGSGNHALDKAHVVTMLSSMVGMMKYLTQHVADVRSQPRAGLITDLVEAAASSDETYPDSELVAMISQLFIAGNETTTKLLSSGLLLLLREPELMGQLQRDYALIPAFVEEVLRLEPPLLAIFRTATADTSIRGVHIPEGADVWLVYSSANRDDAEFSEASEVNLSRSNAQSHLAFGQGPHFCLGAALSSAEARIAFEALFDRLTGFELAAENTLEYDESYMFHGLKELHVNFRRR